MALLKYEEIAESLRARIAAGEFAPGEILPSGRDLAEQWSVSRATTVKALDVLRNDGVVTAKQGTGFVVTETPVARPAGSRKAGSARITGGMPFLRVGEPDWAEPPSRVATVLGMDPGTTTLRRIRVLQLPNGSPHSYAEAWFPPDIAEASPGLLRPHPSRKERLATCAGRPAAFPQREWTSPRFAWQPRRKPTTWASPNQRQSPWFSTPPTTKRGAPSCARRASRLPLTTNR